MQEVLIVEGRKEIPMKTTHSEPDDKRIRPEIWMMGVGIIGVALILGIFGSHSHWFDRYDSGADKPLTSVTVTNAGQPEVPAGFPEPQPNTNVVQAVMANQPTNSVETITFTVRPRFSSAPVNIPETNDQRFVSNTNN